ncbi:MAG: GT4 family glycosyltransferase PelF [Candidatus Kryptonium sp.]|nr:GT4 family glycosyltransferase PelF [Candidatus Kryptonium sp.]MCX7761894.1 GT4 family glycosyltransferase PelF [Candidatus Kryptonium sp.]MDW8108774.1 GT4 family glycosyltransferase PelF [Candidatus Kryptonium sp.]
MKRLSILFETEGTYPFVGGGVSTWADILVNNLRDFDFYIYAVTGMPYVEYKYKLPQNVKLVRQIPLWGSEEPFEDIFFEIPFSSIYIRKTKVNERVVLRKFIPIFVEFLSSLMNPFSDPEECAGYIWLMHRYFSEYDYKQTFRSFVVWQEFKRFVVLSYFKDNPFLREDEIPTVYDLTLTMRWLYHYLMPLYVDVPEVDLSHATAAGFCGLPSIVAKMRDGTPLVVTDHGVFARERYIGIGSEKNLSFFAKKFLINLSILVSKMLYKLADKVLPVSRFNITWEKIFGVDVEKINVIYNGVDPEVFKPKPKPEKTKRFPTVVAAARIMPLKDIETMIKASAIVREKIPDVKFIVYGSTDVDPVYTRKCQLLIRDLKLENTFILAGHHPKPSEVYNEGDISVLSSISEGFPYAVIESMACARPVVATDVGGVREALEGFGIVVKPRDPRALAEGIIKLLTDHELRETLGRRAREEVLAKYRIDLNIDSYRRVYNELAQSKSLQYERKSVAAY